MIRFNRKKMITRSCYAVLVVLTGWFILVLLQFLRWTGVITMNFGADSQIHQATWSTEGKVLMIQYIELLGYLLSSLLMITSSFRLMILCLQGINSKKIFTRKNAKLLWVITFVSFFFTLFYTNIPILFGNREIQFGSNLIVSPLTFLIMTLLYESAVSISEENELTI
ncbi:hypothetical protein CIK91_07005 [Segatella bryantii]|uniref:DUF2975 domain-containing protein n=2 Tax=Segatella bryantii TaxID=77095 RepID=A0ABX4EH39_SEGBR|nr:hypothetical protein CIK91_07005 [Segatella bryantii]